MTDSAVFEGLSPPYRTIVADPPWVLDWHVGPRPDRSLPYSTMGLAAIKALPVGELADGAAHLYLWTTNRYLADSHAIARGWGFKPSQILTWCKSPRGSGPGGAFCSTTEFVLFCRRGSLAHSDRVNTTWFQWPRRDHSVKPPEFLDIVESVSPGPYVELFARAPRLGWDSWGLGFESDRTAV